MTGRVEKATYTRASTVMGMDITFMDDQKGVIEANFVAKPDFENAIGNIHGGFLVAMLDDIMGYAVGITVPQGEFAPTANLNASFLRPARAGILKAKGQILKRDGDVYHLAGKIYNESGELLASATAKAKRGAVVVA